MLVTILVFLLILSVLVLVHEFGHFFVAKLFKIKVEEFGFGLPPRAFGFKKGETMYSINWLPIGGFVKLFGEDEAGAGSAKLKVKSPASPAGGEKLKVKNLKRAFFARPAWQRTLVIVAGVVMNFVLAVALLSYLFAVAGVPKPTGKVFITEVIKNSPAEKAGIKKGDVIISMGSEKITDTDKLISTTNKYLGKKVTVVVKTSKNIIESKEVTPRIKSPAKQGPMGVAISGEIIVVKYPWYEAPIVGIEAAIKDSYAIALGLVNMVGSLFEGKTPQGVAGPLGIAQLTGILCSNTNTCLSFTSMLSLNLAILNILPIPALDGGRLFFILVEVVTGRKVNRKFEGYAHAIGMMLLLGLIALITLHDLFRLITGQPILPKM